MQKKEKPGAFQFYPRDYLSDINVEVMSLEEEGIYVRLLSYCWLQKRLPNDLTVLCQLAKGALPEAVQRVVNTCFKVDQKDNKKLLHARLDLEREKQKKFAKQRSAAGRMSGKVRLRKKLDAEQALPSRSNKTGTKTNSSSSSSSSTADIKPGEEYTPETTVTIVEAPGVEAPPLVRANPTALPDFERWWGGWSQVRGTNHRQQAFIAWMSTVKQAHLPQVYACTASYLASLENPAKGYNPENFLRDQAADGFKARWPAKRAGPVSFGELRKQEAREKFQQRVREEIGNGQRKIQSA